MRTEEDGRSGERHFDSKAAQIKYAAGRRKGGSDQIRRRPEGRIWSNTLPAEGRAELILYAAGGNGGWSGGEVVLEPLGLGLEDGVLPLL